MRIVAIKRFVDSLMVRKYQKTYLTRAGQVEVLKTATKSIKLHSDPRNERLRWASVIDEAKSVGLFGEPVSASRRKGKQPHHDLVRNLNGIIRTGTEPYDYDRYRK